MAINKKEQFFLGAVDSLYMCDKLSLSIYCLYTHFKHADNIQINHTDNIQIDQFPFISISFSICAAVQAVVFYYFRPKTIDHRTYT